MTTPLAPIGADSSVAARPLAGSGAADATSPTTARDPQIAQAARGFEGIFMSQLLEQMLSGTSLATANPLYAGLLTEKLGDALAESGGIGLAREIERQLGGV
ncbi:MAG TPA: hypothetical protein PKE32_00130 [Miltoncostaeaceae bacterium]|nr:hypothetical protein [Miltoncostaeaceae bacterium]